MNENLSSSLLIYCCVRVTRGFSKNKLKWNKLRNFTDKFWGNCLKIKNNSLFLRITFVYSCFRSWYHWLISFSSTWILYVRITLLPVSGKFWSPFSVFKSDFHKKPNRYGRFWTIGKFLIYKQYKFESTSSTFLTERCVSKFCHVWLCWQNKMSWLTWNKMKGKRKYVYSLTC